MREAVADRGINAPAALCDVLLAAYAESHRAYHSQQQVSGQALAVHAPYGTPDAKDRPTSPRR